MQGVGQNQDVLKTQNNIHDDDVLTICGNKIYEGISFDCRGKTIEDIRQILLNELTRREKDKEKLAQLKAEIAELEIHKEYFVQRNEQLNEENDEILRKFPHLAQLLHNNPRNVPATPSAASRPVSTKLAFSSKPMEAFGKVFGLPQENNDLINAFRKNSVELGSDGFLVLKNHSVTDYLRAQKTTKTVDLTGASFIFNVSAIFDTIPSTEVNKI
jgi:hypothetical protein